MPTILAMGRVVARRILTSVAPRSWQAVSAAVTLALVGAPTAAIAQQWSDTLQGGGQVRVDPWTNRPTVTVDGQETQLWDGIHKLGNGRELTVKSGRVVPNEEILESRRPTPEMSGDEPTFGRSACEALVQQVCGADAACDQAEACGPARQLREMERDEQRLAGIPGGRTYTSDRCIDAQRNDFFAPCRRAVDER